MIGPGHTRWCLRSCFCDRGTALPEADVALDVSLGHFGREEDEPIDPETVEMLLDDLCVHMAYAEGTIRQAVSDGDQKGREAALWRWRSWQRLQALLRSQVEWRDEDEPIDPETVGMLLDDLWVHMARTGGNVRQAASDGDQKAKEAAEWRWRSWQRLQALVRSQAEC